jgi:FkbM family methyltransferase
MQTLFLDDERVQVIAKAAGETPGIATLHVSGRDDSSSLLAMAERQTQLYPETAVVGEQAVEVDTLDAMFATLDLPGPVLLKLDVQGYELSALKGATALLERVDTVLTEASFVPFYEGQALFDEVHAWLIDAGFRLAGGAMSAETDGRWEQGDFLYERRTRVHSGTGVSRMAAAA